MKLKKKIKNLSKKGEKRNMASSGEAVGYVLQTRIGKRGIVFTSNFFGGVQL